MVWLLASDQVKLLIPGRESHKGIPVIEDRDIGPNVVTYHEARYRILLEQAESFQLQPNDICLRAEIGPGLTLTAASSSVLVLRPKPEVNLNVPCLVAYLGSTQMVAHLLSSISARPRRPGRMCWPLGGVSANENALPGKSMTTLISCGPAWPYPLAYRRRLAETARPSLEGYRDVLECTETAVCYLALAALVMMRWASRWVISGICQSVSAISGVTQTWAIGWRSCARYKARIHSKKCPAFLIYEVSRFLDDQAVDQAFSRLKQNRDDEAHGRGPRGSEIPAKIAESQAALQTLLKANRLSYSN